MKTESRKFSRVKTRIRAYARKVPSGNVKSLYSCGPTQNFTLPDRVQGIPDPLIQFLKKLDNKIDTVIGLLNKHSMESEFPFVLEITEISGAGIKFTTKEMFQLDEALELALVLSHSPLKVIGIVCTLVRQEGSPEQPVWVAGFTNIRDNDREAIVQYVFHEQRESIRKNRSSKTDGSI